MSNLRLSRLASRLRRQLRRDDLRTTAQTVAAVLLAFLVMQPLALDTASWAVFSALFVVQANIGGTIGFALWRMAGALVGAVLAVALTLLLGQQSHSMMAVLAIGVAAMSVLSARWPDLSYGLVTVAIIAVTPEFAVVEGAFEKVIAIIIGSCCAILACMMVLPMSAYRSSASQLAEALRMSGQYFHECMRCMADGKERQMGDAQSRTVQALEKASLMWRQASIEKTPFAWGHRARPTLSEPLLRQAGLLGEYLALADRFSKMRPSRQMGDEQTAAIQDIAGSIQEQLELLGDSVSGARDRTDMSCAWNGYERLCQAIDAVPPNGQQREAREYVMALKWAFHAIISCIDTLAVQVREARQDPGTNT